MAMPQGEAGPSGDNPNSTQLFKKKYPPDTLWDICLKYCVKYRETFCMQEVTLQDNSTISNPYYVLRSSIFLPSQICDSLLAGFANDPNIVLSNSLLHMFTDLETCRLRNLYLQDSSLSDQYFEQLMKHRPVQVNMSNCPNLTSQSLMALNTHGEQLVSLKLGTYWGLFSDMDLAHDGENNSEIFQPLVKRGPRMPQLRALTIHDLEAHPCYPSNFTALVTKWFLKSKPPLTLLDLSGCEFPVKELHFLENVQTLNKLVLHNVPLSEEGLEQLAKLTNLQALDLSQYKTENVSLEDVDAVMVTLLQQLTRLRWLDVSGTNLAGGPHIVEGEETVFTRGLQGRQLDFLGLLACPGNPCHWPNLPANNITGEHKEEQILLAIETYVLRPQLLAKALYRLLQMLQMYCVQDYERSLLAIFQAMKLQPNDSSVQQLALACLVFASNNLNRQANLAPSNFMPSKLKKEAVVLTLEAMELHRSVEVLVRRGCLVFSYFNLPDDLVFVYERVVTLLVDLTTHTSDENLVQVTLYILKHLSSQVDTTLKEKAGERGAIRAMLDVIGDIVKVDGACDITMIRAWSILWSLTDMAHENSTNFVDHGGLDLFLECYEKYPDEVSLKRKMIGMLVNIAEVAALRPQLMETMYIEKFMELLLEEPSISTSACGVLAHILADGASAWTLCNPSREEVRRAVYRTVAGWELDTPRKVRYRSFEPLHRLFECWETPEVQYWAIWDVHSMVQKDRDRYVPMLKGEGAIELLTQILDDPRVTDEVSSLIMGILECQQNHDVLLKMKTNNFD